MEQLLIVEDDIGLNQGLSKALKADDRQIISCHDLKAAKEQLLCGSVSLLLLDINLPDGSGLELLREVKGNTPYIPVILLTANDTDLDIVDGLERGADDYINKPFSLSGLRARVNTQLRKQASNHKNAPFHMDLFHFDFEAMTFYVGDSKVELSKTEQKLLRLLVENRGRTMTRGDLVDRIWTDGAEYVDENALSVTPEEYLQEKMYGARDVEYTVCALVELPYSMSYRYGWIGYNAVLSVDTAQRDSGGAAIPMCYLFDTADEADEAEAEQYLSKLTVGEFSPLMYESKATARSEFAQFRQMFLLIGGILCAIIGLVGLLNFFNAMMTGILSRRREFAVLQAVGMTNRQLKTMLIYEGLFYAMSSVAAAFMLSLVVGPLAGKMLGSMFWFLEYRFTILPVLLTIPVFLLLGWLIPCMMYDNAAKCSVVEQLRDAQ